MSEDKLVVPVSQILMPDGVTTFKQYVKERGVVQWSTAQNRYAMMGWSLIDAAEAPKGSRLTKTPRRLEQLFRQEKLSSPPDEQEATAAQN